MPKSFASVSLDLDNKWSYLKTHGDQDWDRYPSNLNVVVPRVLQFLERRGLHITFFVVGQDAAIAENQALLRAIAESGHEIGNHSFHHEPWLHLYSQEQLVAEFQAAEQAIEAATGQRPIGFRGPGYSFSPQVLQVLEARGYVYDCSTFPSFLGPLARAYYFFTARLSRAEKQQRKALFGKFSEGFRPLKPYRWQSLGLQLVEIPVTTMPLVKVPVHLSYILYLAKYSRALASSYFRGAMRLCRVMNVQPSILLHPLDFMGCEDDADLGFFPAMDLSRDYKLAVAADIFDVLSRHFELIPMIEHARRVQPREAGHRQCPVA